jgi:hypothetical protein
MRLPTLIQHLGDKSGVVVLAAPDPLLAVQALVRMDRFKLAITSLGIYFSSQMDS